MAIIRREGDIVCSGWKVSYHRSVSRRALRSVRAKRFVVEIYDKPSGTIIERTDIRRFVFFPLNYIMNFFFIVETIRIDWEFVLPALIKKIKFAFLSVHIRRARRKFYFESPFVRGGAEGNIGRDKRQEIA